MRCDAVRRELSVRMDEPATAPDESLGRHLASCADCRAFERGAWRLRELVRVEPADEVPDLVPEIMDRIRAEAPRRPLRRPRGWRREAAAFAAAAVAAAVVVGGLPFLQRGPRPVAAVEIPRRIAAASAEVAEYRAAFDVVERNFLPAVPVRRFEARIAFRAPEAFRAEIRDRTEYPDPSWPRNDVVLAIDADRWSLSGPAACPREALPGCAVGGGEERAVRGREPFDGDTPLPTDVVLPVKSLSGAGRLRMVGPGAVGGRPTVTVALAYRDATPLFASLHAGGSWRPYFPLDRVEVALDRESWFPLAYRVVAAEGMEREAWASRNGLHDDRPGMVLLEAEARSFRASVPDGWSPRAAAGGAARDAGFRDVPPAALAGEVGFSPAVPEDLRGLAPDRAGVPAAPAGTAATTYVRGLTWLKIRESRSWEGGGLFGDLGPLAALVSLPGGGIGYYEPPAATRGARLGLHAAGADLFLESNLPREDLLAVAGSLPVRGLPTPEAWRTRRLPDGTLREGVSPARARRAVPGLLLPEALPPEYRLWTVHLLEGPERAAATVFFRRPRGELDGPGIRLHQEPGAVIPPPTDPGALAVRVRGALARYSPLRGELEWVESGAYRSLRAEGLGLARLVRVAESLGPPEGGAG